MPCAQPALLQESQAYPSGKSFLAQHRTPKQRANLHALVFEIVMCLKCMSRSDIKRLMQCWGPPQVAAHHQARMHYPDRRNSSLNRAVAGRSRCTRFHVACQSEEEHARKPPCADSSYPCLRRVTGKAFLGRVRAWRRIHAVA